MFHGSMDSCEKSFPFAKKENHTPIEIDRSMKWFLEFHSMYSSIFSSMQIRWEWYRLANDWPNTKFTFLGCEMPIVNWLKKMFFIRYECLLESRWITMEDEWENCLVTYHDSWCIASKSAKLMKHHIWFSSYSTF